MKWLQYETVLGPETSDVIPVVPSAPGTAGPNATTDIEKHAGADSGNNGGKLAVTGPGLGDLLTEGPTQVFDLEKTPGPLEIRLERIEALLARLVPADGADTGRISSATYVDEAPAVAGNKGEMGAHHRVGQSEGLNGGQHAPFTHGVAGAGGRPHVDDLGKRMP